MALLKRLKAIISRKRYSIPEDPPRPNFPQPLPDPRPRRLTLPSVSDNETHLQVAPASTNQHQSSLLSIIPWEIRQMIYQEVLGGNVLHIMRVSERLAHNRCTQPGPKGRTTWGHKCWGEVRAYGYAWLRPIKGWDYNSTGLLNLLKTSRQVWVSPHAVFTISPNLTTAGTRKLSKFFTPIITSISSIPPSYVILRRTFFRSALTASPLYILAGISKAQSKMTCPTPQGGSLHMIKLRGMIVVG